MQQLAAGSEAERVKLQKSLEENQAKIRELEMQIKRQETSESERESVRNKRNAQDTTAMECIQEQRELIIKLRSRINRNESRSDRVRLSKSKDLRQGGRRSLDAEESRSDRTEGSYQSWMRGVEERCSAFERTLAYAELIHSSEEEKGKCAGYQGRVVLALRRMLPL